MPTYRAAAMPKMRPTHPGAVLRDDVLPALGVTVSRAASELGVSRQFLHRILAAKAPVTVEMALRLGKWCGNGPHVWIALQRDHDVWKAEGRLVAVLRTIPTRKAA